MLTQFFTIFRNTFHLISFILFASTFSVEHLIILVLTSQYFLRFLVFFFSHPLYCSILPWHMFLTKFYHCLCCSVIFVILWCTIECHLVCAYCLPGKITILLHLLYEHCSVICQLLVCCTR